MEEAATAAGAAPSQRRRQRKKQKAARVENPAGFTVVQGALSCTAPVKADTRQGRHKHARHRASGKVNQKVLRHIARAKSLRMDSAVRMREVGASWCTRRGGESIPCPFRGDGCPVRLRGGSFVPHVLGRHRELLSVAGVAAFVAGLVHGAAQWRALKRRERISALEETVAALQRAVRVSSQRLEAATDALALAELPPAAAEGDAAAAAAASFGYCDNGGSWEEVGG